MKLATEGTEDTEKREITDTHGSRFQKDVAGVQELCESSNLVGSIL